MKSIRHLFSILALVIVSSTAVALEVGSEAPCVVLDHVQNGIESNHCIREPQIVNRPVLIEFFSITCSACVANLPNIKALAKSLEGKATVRLVSIDKDAALVTDFIKQQNVELEVAFDVDRYARKAYEVFVTPTLFVLDQKNIIRSKHMGVLSAHDQMEIVDLVGSL